MAELTVKEIKKLLIEKINDMYHNRGSVSNYFLLPHGYFQVDDIPEIVKFAREICGWVHETPKDGGYEASLHRKGYNSTYTEQTKIPLEIIPRVKSVVHPEKEYPMNCGFDAYAMYVRDWTHDYNMYVNNLGYIYGEYKNDPEETPADYVRAYANFIRPYIQTMVRCIEHLANEDQYEGENLYICRYSKKSKLYQVRRLVLRKLEWDGNIAWSYEPVSGENLTVASYKPKIVRSFEKVS